MLVRRCCKTFTTSKVRAKVRRTLHSRQLPVPKRRDFSSFMLETTEPKIVAFPVGFQRLLKMTLQLQRPRPRIGRTHTANLTFSTILRLSRASRHSRCFHRCQRRTLRYLQLQMPSLKTGLENLPSPIRFQGQMNCHHLLTTPPLNHRYLQSPSYCLNTDQKTSSSQIRFRGQMSCHHHLTAPRHLYRTDRLQWLQELRRKLLLSRHLPHQQHPHLRLVVEVDS